MDAVSLPRGRVMSTAGYLRCHAYDIWHMRPHRVALLQHARALSLPEPDIYLDNGCPARGPLPQLDRLLGAVAAGTYQAVLLPEWLALALDEARAGQMIEHLEQHNCLILCLPPRSAESPPPAPVAIPGMQGPAG